MERTPQSGSDSTNLQQRLIKSSLTTMVAIKDRHALSVSLGTFDQSVPDGVVIEHVTADRTHAMVLKTGLRLILHAGAPGKAYLAHLPPRELDDIIPRLELTRFTDNTITTREGLLRELAAVRRQGYAVDNSEYTESTGCVGAAILDSRQYPVGAIWVHGLLQHLQEKGCDLLGGEIVKAAGQISAKMQMNQYQNQRDYADFVIETARQQLAGDLSSRVDVKALAARYHVSYSTLGHWFKERQGCGPSRYHLQLRLEAAMRRVRETQETVKDIAEDLGFDDHIHFFKLFKKRFGHPPLHFRK